MTNKALTILIADHQHLNRLHIEKSLNQLGYYRIAPVQSADELMILARLITEPCGLLVISREMASAAGVEPAAFSRCYPGIRHVLIYDSQPGEQMTLAHTPDTATLVHLMKVIDPAPPTYGLQVLPWLQELSTSRVV